MSIEFTPEAVAAAQAALGPALARTEPISLSGTSARKLAVNLATQLKQLSADERAQIGALHGIAGFDIAALTTCEQATALLWDSTRARSTAAAQADDRVLPVALLTEASDQRALLFKVLDYHLGADPAAAAELASIRAGTGHLDLATDLQRLAKLAGAHAATLAGDRFLPADAVARADALAAQMLGLLTDNAPDDRLRTADEQGRILAVLNAAYTELSAAARFALRNSPIGETFESIRSISRR